MNDIAQFLRCLIAERFYGSVTLKFEAGHVVTIKKEQTLKPTDLSEQPRKESAETQS